MEQRKGQAAMEYLLIVGLAFIILTPMLYIFYDYTTTLRREVNLAKVYNIGGNNERTNLQMLDALCDALEALAPSGSNPRLRARGIARYRDLITAQLRKAKLPEVAEWSAGAAQRIEENVLVSHNWDQIRRLMWNYVGIVRTEKRLALVQERLRVIVGEVNQHYHDYILTPDLIELRNIAQVAELIVRCACIRKESRGLHYLVDFPKPDDAHWKKDTIIRRQDNEPGLVAAN